MITRVLNRPGCVVYGHGCGGPAAIVLHGRFTATAWPVLDAVDDTVLERLRQARAVARGRAWLLRAEAGRPAPAVSCGGVVVPGLVIDLDASLVTCDSESNRPGPRARRAGVSPAAGLAEQHP